MGVSAGRCAVVIATGAQWRSAGGPDLWGGVVGVVVQGYQQMMEWFGGVRRVRGDNYCALRATLFQVLSQTTQSPAWLHQDHFTMVTARPQTQPESPEQTFLFCVLLGRKKTSMLR